MFIGGRRSLVFGLWFLVLGLGFCDLCFELGALYLVLGSWFLVLWCLAKQAQGQSTKHKVPSTEFKDQSPKP
jgi:hypothetical protein